MKVNQRTIGDVLILDLAGRIEMGNCRTLQDTYMGLVKQGRRKLALNLSSIEYMDSAGLATLIQVLHLARHQGVQVRFFSPSGRVRALMEITHLDNIMPLSEDEPRALAAFV